MTAVAARRLLTSGHFINLRLRDTLKSLITVVGLRPLLKKLHDGCVVRHVASSCLACPRSRAKVGVFVEPEADPSRL